MNVEDFRNYCLQKPAVSEGFPFGEETLVFKVVNKIFAITSLEGEFAVNLKCDPEWALELREKYEQVEAGYHMNKKHWNTVRIDGSIPTKQILQMIDHSYDLVVNKLTKPEREFLKQK